ncbi:hypothetical protein E5D57_003580 [Metarhizium anisopliae]|nr:hypothetical protein E5D57_003580 [Metarhizium anisopliae]
MTVWETSYLAVSEQLPEASQLLTLLSFIQYEDIFLDLFDLSIDSCLTAVPPWTSILGCQVQVDLPYLEKCFRILEKYSLCQHQTIQCSYSIHRLVHAWGFDRLQGGQQAYRFWLAASQLLDDNVQAMKSPSTEPTLKLRVASHVTENLKAFMELSSVSDETQICSLNTVQHYYFFFDGIGGGKKRDWQRVRYSRE